MKTNKKIDIHLYNIYKDLYNTQDEINEAIKDARRAFKMVQQDVIYKSGQP